MAIDLVVLVSLGPNMMIILASHHFGGLPKRHTSWCVLEGISSALSEQERTNWNGNSTFPFPYIKRKEPAEF